MIVLLMLSLIAADQITKYLAVTYLKPVGTIPVIEGIFNFTFVENSGAAFGILQGGRWFFVTITAVILTIMLVYYRKLPKEKPYSYLRFFLALVASGALGNFIDRFLHGFVVDFLHFTPINFPVFNIADCFVFVGAFSIVFIFLFIIKE